MKKVHFTTSVKLPKSFAPTVIANFTRGFAGLTLTKMLKKAEEKKAAERAARQRGSP